MSQPHLDPWERDGTTNPGYHFQVRKTSGIVNLIKVYDKMTCLVDEGRAVDIVNLDFSRAFDSVYHKMLIDKLVMCGLDKQPVRWTESCLNSRVTESQNHRITEC